MPRTRGCSNCRGAGVDYCGVCGFLRPRVRCPDCGGGGHEPGCAGLHADCPRGCCGTCRGYGRVSRVTLATLRLERRARRRKLRALVRGAERGRAVADRLRELVEKDALPVALTHQNARDLIALLDVLESRLP